MIPSDDKIKEIIQKIKEDEKKGITRPVGYYSNAVITGKNKGVVHQFINDIGGCSENYR